MIASRDWLNSNPAETASPMPLPLRRHFLAQAGVCMGALAIGSRDDRHPVDIEVFFIELSRLVAVARPHEFEE